MKLITIALLGLFLSLNAFALHTPRGKGKISKASSVSKYTVKFLAVIEVPGAQALQQCTGTFISSRTILTAAHCVEWADHFEELMVITFKGSEPVDIQVIEKGDYKTRMHEDFSDVAKELGLDSAASYDIGLLTFKKGGYTVKQHAKLYNFPENIDSDPVLEQVLGLGAGQKNIILPFFRKFREQLNTLAGELKATALDLQSVDFNSGTYRTEQGFRVCVGDSGGPVLAIHKNQVKILGVFSAGLTGLFSRNCGKTVYVALISDENHDWVRENMKALEKEI